MNNETKKIFEVYKLLCQITTGRFFGYRPEEIIATLEKFTGANLEYKEAEALKEAITKCKLKNGII